MKTKPRCVCGHEEHEHDHTYPGGEPIYCCRHDIGCFCEKYEPEAVKAEKSE